METLEQKKPRRIKLSCPLCCHLFLLMSAHNWTIGGSVSGARYITAGIPFLLFPIAAFLAWIPRSIRSKVCILIVSLGLIGISINHALISTLPWLPVKHSTINANPITSMLWPIFETGRSNMTILHRIGMDFRSSHIIFISVLLLTLSAYLFNLLYKQAWKKRLSCLVISTVLTGFLFIGWLQIGTGTQIPQHRIIEGWAHHNLYHD